MLQLGVDFQLVRRIRRINHLHARAHEAQHETVLKLQRQRRRGAAVQLELRDGDPRVGLRGRSDASDDHEGHRDGDGQAHVRPW